MALSDPSALTSHTVVVEVEVLLKRWVNLGGEQSMVAEMDARGVPGARNDCCLIRSNNSAIRRIWSYPADWNRLEDDRLMSLFEAPYSVN